MDKQKIRLKKLRDLFDIFFKFSKKFFPKSLVQSNFRASVESYFEIRNPGHEFSRFYFNIYGWIFFVNYVYKGGRIIIRPFRFKIWQVSKYFRLLSIFFGPENFDKFTIMNNKITSVRILIRRPNFIKNHNFVFLEKKLKSKRKKKEKQAKYNQLFDWVLLNYDSNKFFDIKVYKKFIKLDYLTILGWSSKILEILNFMRNFRLLGNLRFLSYKNEIVSTKQFNKFYSLFSICKKDYVRPIRRWPRRRRFRRVFKKRFFWKFFFKRRRDVFKKGRMAIYKDYDAYFNIFLIMGLDKSKYSFLIFRGLWAKILIYKYLLSKIKRFGINKKNFKFNFSLLKYFDRLKSSIYRRYSFGKDRKSFYKRLVKILVRGTSRNFHITMVKNSKTLVKLSLGLLGVHKRKKKDWLYMRKVYSYFMKFLKYWQAQRCLEEMHYLLRYNHIKVFKKENDTKIKLLKYLLNKHHVRYKFNSSKHRVLLHIIFFWYGAKKKKYFFRNYLIRKLNYIGLKRRKWKVRTIKIAIIDKLKSLRKKYKKFLIVKSISNRFYNKKLHKKQKNYKLKSFAYRKV